MGLDMSEFKPVESKNIGCHLCYFDMLDGVDLRDGDKILVQWPEENDVSVEIVNIEYYSINGHTSAKSWIEIPYRGVSAKLYLSDFNILCKRQQENVK